MPHDHPDFAQSLNSLGNVYTWQGRYPEAEPLFKRALGIREKSLGRDHPDVATSLNDLGDLYTNQSRYAEAEPLYRRALVIRDKVLGSDHPNVGTTLTDLGDLYTNQERYGEAEPLYKRALAIRERSLGREHPDVATSLNDLGDLYTNQERYGEAEPLYKRALAIREKSFHGVHPDVAQTLHDLGDLYTAQRRYTEAEALYKRALAMRKKALGAEHPHVGQTLHDLAELYVERGQYANAQPLYIQSLAIRQKALGPDHEHVERSLNALASLHFAQGDWVQAANYWKKSTELIIRRSERGADFQMLTGKARSDAERTSNRFAGLVRASHRIGAGTANNFELSDDMFKIAQWGRFSDAAASLAQMGARQAKGSGPLATIVRERQDLVREWQARDTRLIEVLSQSSDRRDAAVEQQHRARLSAIEARIAEIDETLARDFADYAALANPHPVGITEVQQLLTADEALLLFVDTAKLGPAPEETFIWVVTKSNVRWVRSELGTPTLKRQVAALRCGLDYYGAWRVNDSECPKLTGVTFAAPDALPFDLARAHDLYFGLFGQIEDEIRGKHLLVVPSGPLTAFPFQALVTRKPAMALPKDTAGYAGAAWLSNSHAVSVLPSAASLKVLRQFAKTSKAPQPFIGFGNPLLFGPSGTDMRAWARQSCEQAAPPSAKIASRKVLSPMSRYFRGDLADVNLIRRQEPLPETADELCAVAHSVGAADAAVYLGERASETTLKALSGALSDARIVHFATHGLLATEASYVGSTKAEPGLILTPPALSTSEDDGLLTASEVTLLKLNADWVVLSACNTAGGDALNAEALSGLARAFFYAGARALLVSHWAVNSQATVSLITKAFDEMRDDGKIGRAEALRRSMLTIIRSGGRNAAHPANWAPFVVVGEGAR